VLLMQVLCAANRSQQLLLFELLCSYHTQLAGAAPAGHAGCKDADPAAAAAAPVAATDARLVAFLLLVKHLSGFYFGEQALFKQKVIAAMKQTTDADPTAGAGGGGGNGIHATPNQQQQQGFAYMLGEEEAACVEASTARFTANLLAETAPACYLPLLLHLVGAQEAPSHVRVRGGMCWDPVGVLPLPCMLIAMLPAAAGGAVGGGG
jgi:hypothetical protein